MNNQRCTAPSFFGKSPQHVVCKENMRRNLSVLTLLFLSACSGCTRDQDVETTQSRSPHEIPKQQELLWSLSESGKFEVKIEKYDPKERIVYVSRPQSLTPNPDAGKSVLAHEFANGTTLPYQFDGTNWIPLWSPSLPPELEPEQTESTQQQN